MTLEKKLDTLELYYFFPIIIRSIIKIPHKVDERIKRGNDALNVFNSLTGFKFSLTITTYTCIIVSKSMYL